jgi:hypothetical protein
METIKVKPWGEGQGDFVLLNAADFVEGQHELYEPAAPEPEPEQTPPAEPEAEPEPAEAPAAQPASTPARKRATPTAG